MDLRELGGGILQLKVTGLRSGRVHGQFQPPRLRKRIVG
jgi:hypothetical protein